MLTQEQERILRLARKAMDGYLPQTADDAKLAQEFAPIMRHWIAGTMENPVTYGLNDLRTENGIPYKCTNPHTHHGEEGWNPESGTALWRRFHGTSVDTAWEFIADGANPYLKDEYCLENGIVYKCIAESTVYAPSEYAVHWEAVEEAAE